MLSGYWTDGVGCSIETLAELMGDTPKVAFDHYGKEWGQHYQAPLWAAIGESVEKSKRAVKQSKPAHGKTRAASRDNRSVNSKVRGSREPR
jgi:hypothetical protein